LDCFNVAVEAWRIATSYMVPVFIMSDGYLATGSEPWRIPAMKDLTPFPVEHPGPAANGAEWQPYARNDKLARPWAIPGTPGLMHRIGGLEKHDVTGDVSYDPENHQRMTDLRARKVAGIAHEVPQQEVEGPASGEVLVLGWGGTYGAIASAVRNVWQHDGAVAHAHLRYINPFPANLGEVIKRYRKVLIP